MGYLKWRAFVCRPKFRNATFSQDGHHRDGHTTSHATEPHHEHRAATWFELFWDLVFVALMAKWGHSYESMHFATDYYSLRNIFLLFLPVWSTWWSFTVYMNRFDQLDLYHGFLFFVATVCMGFMSVNVEYCQTLYICKLFTVSVATLRFILACAYGRIAYHYHKQDNGQAVKIVEHCMFWAIFNVVICICWIVNTIIDPDTDDNLGFQNMSWVFTWWAPTLIEFPLSLCFELVPYFRDRFYLALNSELIVERLGLFVVLSLGEMVVASTGIAVSDENIEIAAKSALSVLGIAALALQMKILYFDISTVPEDEKGYQHAIHRSPIHRVLFFILHFPICSFLPLIAAGLTTINDNHLTAHVRRVIGVFFVLVSLSILAIQTLHKYPSKPHPAEQSATVHLSESKSTVTYSSSHSQEGDAQYLPCHLRSLVQLAACAGVMILSLVDPDKLAPRVFLLLINLVICVELVICYLGTRIPTSSQSSQHHHSSQDSDAYFAMNL